MSAFPVAAQAVYVAVIKGDFQQVNALVAAGANLNVFNGSGDTLLDYIVDSLAREPSPFSGDMLRLLLQLGADPNMLGDGDCSALTTAMLFMDSELLEILLIAGADPNQPCGFDDSESFYDWAEFDYRYNVWMGENLEEGSINPTDEPTDADRVSEESWLDYLDRVAVKYGVRRPDHLYLLRKYGANTAHESKGKAIII